MNRAAWMVSLALSAACAHSAERAAPRAPASSEAEEAPARAIATSLAHDPLTEQAAEEAPQHSHAHSPADAVTYTCPMHPEVQQAGPGECPKCGMRLVPKPPSTSSEAKPAHEHAN